MAQRRTSDLGDLGQGPPMKQARSEAKSEEPSTSRGPRHELLLKGVRYPVLRYPDLTELQRLYEESPGPDKIVEVVIPPEAVNSNTNHAVENRNLWGDVIYTCDSDLAVALLHQGYYSQNHMHPPNQVYEVRVLLRLLPPQPSYAAKMRFLRIKSRHWNLPWTKCSYQVECCWLVLRSGAIAELHPYLAEAPAPFPTVHSRYNRQTLMTRSTGRQAPKLPQDSSISFNLCNEPWPTYTISAVADRGMHPAAWTSAQLLDKALFLETMRARYQVVRTGDVTDGDQKKDVYSLSKCVVPLPATIMRRIGVPLPAELVQMEEQGVGWEEFQWGVSSVVVRGRELQLKRFHLQPLCTPGGGS